MKNFEFWFTLGTATIPAIITGLLSFFASWLKNRSDIKSLEKQFQHDTEMASLTHNHQINSLQKQFKQDFEKMDKTHKQDFEKLEKNHQQELDKMKAAHQLELENIQKRAEAEMTNTITKEFMGMLGTVLTPALSKQLENTDILNQPKK